MDNLENGKLKLTKLDKRTIDINKSNIQKQTELLNMNTKMFNMNNNTKVGKYVDGIDLAPYFISLDNPTPLAVFPTLILLSPIAPDSL